MSAHLRAKKKAWAELATAMLVQAGVSITRLPGGAYRILSGENLTLVQEISDLKPAEVGEMLSEETRYNAMNA